MKTKIFLLLAMVSLIISCNKPKSLTTTETALIGQWKHTNSTMENTDGSVYNIPLNCTNAKITFTDQVIGNPTDYADFDFVDDRACYGIPSTWKEEDQSTIYISNTKYTIITLNSTNLVLQINGSTKIEYYTKL